MEESAPRRSFFRSVFRVAVGIMAAAVTLLALEAGLRLFGFRTIVGRATANESYARLIQKRVCDRIGSQDLVAYDTFAADSQGIFKANRDAKDRPAKSQRVAFNDDGFRGRPFQAPCGRRVTILMVGDSFTYGASAVPLDKSFADLVDKAGYHVYNGGIPGTGPGQYARLVEIYVPLLKPRVTAIFLYLGNDVKVYPDPIQPGKSPHYVTNFGFLRGYDHNGRYFDDAREAFDYMRKRYCGCTDSLWDVLVFKTVIGGTVADALDGPSRLKPDPERRLLIDRLNTVRDICRRNESRFLLFFIPVVPRNAHPAVMTETNALLLGAFDPLYPATLDEADYAESPDNHFNNRGHRKYADFILGALADRGFPPEGGEDEGPPRDSTDHGRR
jgi:hypothetical protein